MLGSRKGQPSLEGRFERTAPALGQMPRQKWVDGTASRRRGGNIYQRFMAQHKKGRPICCERFFLTPMPQLPQHGERRPPQGMAAFNTPYGVQVRQPLACGLRYEARAGFLMPGESALFLQLRNELFR